MTHKQKKRASKRARHVTQLKATTPSASLAEQMEAKFNPHVRSLTHRERLISWGMDRLVNWETRVSDKAWEKHHGRQSRGTDAA